MQRERELYLVSPISKQLLNVRYGNMLESLFITDCTRTALVHRKFRESFKEIEPTMLSGLISAIDSIGRLVFNKEFAVVTYGEDNISNIGDTVSKIVNFSKDLFAQDKRISFVFFSTGDCSIKILRQLVTTLYIELKNLLRDEQPNHDKIGLIVNKIIDNNFKGIKNCF